MTARPLLPRLLTTLLALALLGLVAPALASALAPLAPGGVTGRVVSAVGAPQAGLAVRLLDLRNLRRSVTTRTGADGRFSFTGAQRPENFAVQVCEAGNPCRGVPQATRTVKRYVGPEGTAHSLLALRRYFTTTGSSPAVALGTVRTVRPAAAVISLRNGSTGGWVEVSGLRAPVRQGVATVRGLAPGRHLATTHGQRKVFSVRAGGTARVTFGVRLATVTGRVVEAGRPLANEPVSLEGSAGSLLTTRTDRNGRYTFRELLGSPAITYRLRFGMGRLQLLHGYPKAYKRFQLSPAQVKRVDVAVPQGSRGAVEVTIEGGANAQRPAHVSLLSPTGSWIGGMTMTGTAATIDELTPGTYVVYAQWTSASQNRALNDWRTVTVTRGTVTPALLAGRSGPGSITVTAAPGDQVDIASTAPVIEAQDPRAGTLSLYRWKSLVDTDTVVFPDVPDGSYLVRVRAGNSPGDQPEPVEVTVSGGEIGVDLAAGPRQGSLRGRLVDPATGREWPWTARLVQAFDCTTAASGGDVGGDYFVPQALDLEVRVLDLVGGDYSCSARSVYRDPGTPYVVGPEGRLPMRGTVRVTPGQETTVDLPVPFAAVS